MQVYIANPCTILLRRHKACTKQRLQLIRAEVRREFCNTTTCCSNNNNFHSIPSDTKPVSTNDSAAYKLTITQRIGSDEHSKVQSFQLSSSSDLQHNSTFDPPSSATQSSTSSSITSLLHKVTTHFLPKGYPYSVASGYQPYVLRQMASSVLSSAGGVLSMQALLKAIGIGAAGAIPLAATLNWILKDGLGQLGGVLFASMVSNRFDIDPKRWRFLSSVALEFSNFIELLTPLVPQYFLPIASFANIGKNISFLSASASRAAIHKTFAIQENLADITAKTGSQSILSSMIGTGLGISAATVIATSFDGSIYATAAIFSVLSTSSLLLAYGSLQNVTLTTLSVTKLEIIFQHYLSQIKQNQSTEKSLVVILSPQEMKEREKWLLVAPINHLPALNIGSHVQEAFPGGKELLPIAKLFENRGYLINITNSSSGNEATVHLLYKEGAAVMEMMYGVLHAYLIRDALHNSSTQQTNKSDIDAFGVIQETFEKYVVNTSSESTQTSLVQEFITKFQTNQQWHVAESILEPKYARISTTIISTDLI